MRHLNESFSQLWLDLDRSTVSSAIKQTFLVKPDIYWSYLFQCRNESERCEKWHLQQANILTYLISHDDRDKIDMFEDYTKNTSTDVS